MDFWKPKTPQEPVLLRFTAIPNTYKTVDSADVSAKAELDKYTTRREKVALFVKNVGWGDSPLGQAILKSLDDKITELQPKPVVKVIPVVDAPVPAEVTEKDFADWKTMTPAHAPVQKTKPEKLGQLTTKFDLTVDYIRKNIMPILNRYTLHEVDAFSALFAKFRADSDYAVVLTVRDNSIFRMTPEIAVNMVVTLYEQGHLK